MIDRLARDNETPLFILNLNFREKMKERVRELRGNMTDAENACGII